MTARNPFGLLDDAELPRLAEALDGQAMTARFAAAFEKSGAARATSVRSCLVEEIYHRPGRSCGVLYRVGLDGPDGRPAEEWLHARMFPRELLRVRHQKALDAVAGGARALPASGLEPVTLCEDPGMIVWAFPCDPRLPDLPAMADRGLAARRFAGSRPVPVTAASPEGAPEPARWRSEFERIKYMPGKRCVLRYRMTPDTPDAMHANGHGPETFIAKAYPAGVAADAFRRQRSAWSALRAAGSPVEIAEPISHVAGESVVWFEDRSGEGLVAAAARSGWDTMAERAAEALAAFHLTPIPGLGPAPGPDDVLEGARERGGKFATWVPAQRDLVQAMLSRLESRRGSPGERRPSVAVHGEFRAEHVVLRGERTVLLDLDELSQGDPLLDAAEFVSWLEFRELCGGSPPLDSASVSRRFIARYAEAVPWPVEPARLGWYALASLVRRLHGAVRRLAWPALDRLERDGPRLAERWLSLADGADVAPVVRIPANASGSPRPAPPGGGAR